MSKENNKMCSFPTIANILIELIRIKRLHFLFEAILSKIVAPPLFEITVYELVVQCVTYNTTNAWAME